MSVEAAEVRASYYPVYLDLRDRACLVVGGGPIAIGKARGLLEAGARVTIVAPDAGRDVWHWQAEGGLTRHARAFREDDLVGQFLVVAATDDRALNSRIYQLANDAGLVANAVDDLDHCNFIAPAVARAGSIQVAVSTAGKSPALAKQLRDRIAREVLTEPTADLAEFLGAWRAEVKHAILGYARRQAFWEGVLDGCIPGLLAAGDEERAHRAMGECLQRARIPTAVEARCAAEPARPASCRACQGAA